MILKDLMDHFDITANLPDYLLNHPFNEVFLDGKLTVKDDCYEIVDDVYNQLKSLTDGMIKQQILKKANATKV
jgi:hypothetical protein